MKISCRVFVMYCYKCLFTEEISEDISPQQSQRSTFREEEAEEESETPPIESDSEGLVIAPRPSKRKQKPESKPVGYAFNTDISKKS